MTLLQTHPRPAHTNAGRWTATDAMDASALQVWDDMTVEVALSVMSAARTNHLVVCDEDGRYTGLVTRTRLTAVRNGSAYTDRVRLRDIAAVDGPVSGRSS